MKKNKKPAVKSNFLSNTLEIIKQNKKFFLVTLFILLVIYTFFYGIWEIPVLELGFIRDSEVILIDYLFIGATSLFISSLFTLIKYEKKQKFKTSSKYAGAFSLLAGFTSAICPTCQGVTFVALGFSAFDLYLGPIIPYLGALQILSVGLLGLALTLKAESIYTKDCKLCKIKK